MKGMTDGILFRFAFLHFLFLLFLLFRPDTVEAMACREQSLQADFRLEYASGPVAADRGSHEFILIEPAEQEGAERRFILKKGLRDSFYSKSTGELTWVEDIIASRSLDTHEIQLLFDALNENCYWNMDEKYRDRDILDGSYEMLKVRNDGAEHQVVCVNIRKKRFESIEKRLRSLILDE